MDKKRLIRPDNRVLAGVCAGLANYFGLNVWLVRIVFLLLTVPTALIVVLLYLVLYFLMPSSRWDNVQKDDK